MSKMRRAVTEVLTGPVDKKNMVNDHLLSTARTRLAWLLPGPAILMIRTSPSPRDTLNLL
jgi:hypothetical protein